MNYRGLADKIPKTIRDGEELGKSISSRYQADGFAYLNTLFGYDIGFEAAYALIL